MADETKTSDKTQLKRQPSQEEQAREFAAQDQRAAADGAPETVGPVRGVKPSTLPQTPAAEVEHPGVVAVNPGLLADEPEAHIDRVAMVSRDKNGKPDQSADFEVLVPEDAHESEKAAALNLPVDF